jgi:hypothetical protein
LSVSVARQRWLPKQQRVQALIDVGAVERLLEDVGDREAMRRLHELAGSTGY